MCEIKERVVYAYKQTGTLLIFYSLLHHFYCALWFLLVQMAIPNIGQQYLI